MDDVQQRLRELDQQIGGGDSFGRQVLTGSPLVICAAGFIAGIVLQDRLGLQIWWWLALLFAGALAAVGVFLGAKKDTPVGALGVLACVCFVSLGAVRLISFRHLSPNNISHFVGDERTLATIRGTVISAVKFEDRDRWAFGRFVPADPSGSFYLRLEGVQTPTGWEGASGVVPVYVGQRMLDLAVGDYIQAYCWLDRFKPPTNPGQFDIAKYLARKSVFIAASIESRDGIELLERTENPAKSTATAVREKLREIAADALLDAPLAQNDSEALLAALLLGQRAQVTPATLNAFRRTGLLHFISLSGLHVGILLWGIWWVGRRLGLLRQWRALVCMLFLGVFILVVPSRAPILRAGVMAATFCIAVIVRQRPNTLNTLALAAIVLLLFRPIEVFSAGWQLSFVTVLGIILFAGRLKGFLCSLTGSAGAEPGQSSSRAARVARSGGHFFVGLLSVGLAAWVAAAGVLLYHFYTITPLASVWTALVFPLVAVVLGLGFLKIVFAFLLPVLAGGLGATASFFSNLLIWVVRGIDRLNVSEIVIGKAPNWVILGYYGLVIFVGLVEWRRRGAKRAVSMAAGLILVGGLGVLKWQHMYPQGLEVTCLSVGHGQAVFCAMPGGAKVLFDAGSLTVDDCGRRIVVPFLYYSGINKLDAIIISHDDIDHINGIPEVVADCRVKAVYAGSGVADAASSRGAVGYLKDSLETMGVALRSIGERLPLRGDGLVKVLWPVGEFASDANLTENDRSLVTVIEFAGRRILLPSDIEQTGQRGLLDRRPGLKADVMLACHHGSVRSLWAGFMEQLRPEILIFSSGRTQYEKSILQPLLPVRSYYTTRDGAVRIRIDRHGTLTAQTFGSGE
jgi:competence protein ComEC